MGTPLVGNILSCAQCLVMGCVSTITPLDHNPSRHHNDNQNKSQNNKHGHGSNHNNNHNNNNHHNHNLFPPSRSYRFHTDLPYLLQRLIFLSSDLSYLVLRQFRSFLLPSDTRYCTSTSTVTCLPLPMSFSHVPTYSHPPTHTQFLTTHTLHFTLVFSHYFPTPSFLFPSHHFLFSIPPATHINPYLQLI